MVQVGCEDDVPVRLVREGLVILPPAEPGRPVHDDQGFVPGDIPPCQTDGLLVEVQQMLSRDVAWVRAGAGAARTPGLVQKLDAPADFSVGAADLGHLRDGQRRQVPVPFGVEVRPALVAAREGIGRLASRGAMQIQQHLEAESLCIRKDAVNPLVVQDSRTQDALQLAPALGACSIWCRGSWKVDDVPIAQRQTHDVETQGSHPLEVLKPDAAVKELLHAPASIRCSAHVAETGGINLRTADLARVSDAIE
mmetsp:Transcript_77595/g.214418  ORF Transcript_77595/g.214418 Transcript_77595/m.214418 type:complete len:252 (+) Transcript_77595:400-1155(+)